ncbi:MAG TPA: hypothetical protein DCE42_19210, partial [Myxococcales bacterium]|nr:hypothetical protein [Myxococcales bacterium]
FATEAPNNIAPKPAKTKKQMAAHFQVMRRAPSAAEKDGTIPLPPIFSAKKPPINTNNKAIKFHSIMINVHQKHKDTSQKLSGHKRSM